MQISDDKKIQLLYRVEPGCLGPTGAQTIERFCDYGWLCWIFNGYNYCDRINFDSGDFSDFENSYMVGVMAEWEFFDGNQRSNKAQAAKAEWRAGKREEEKVINNLRLDLHQAFLKASEAWQRLEVTKKSVENAKEALRITGEQYREGAAGITMLLTAQVGLTAQKTRNVAAYYDYLMALSNFERASGEAVKTYIH